MAFSVKVTLRNVRVSKRNNKRSLWECTLPLLAQELLLQNLSELWLSVKWIFTGNWPALSSNSSPDSDQGPAQREKISLFLLLKRGCCATTQELGPQPTGMLHLQECFFEWPGHQKNLRRVLKFNTRCISKGKQISLAMVLSFWSFVGKQQFL